MSAVVGLALFLGVLIALVGVIKIVIAIVYWSSCPSANLSLYLLVSGISPFLFYVTCRTRRKHQGKAPETQRIVGRWRFSAFPCTLDTERSWQAGLAGVLSFFLLVWLVYGENWRILRGEMYSSGGGDLPKTTADTRRLSCPHNLPSDAKQRYVITHYVIITFAVIITVNELFLVLLSRRKECTTE
ncbi:hypothetical protein ACOMHN_017393 [Nucella lapillus]